MSGRKLSRNFGKRDLVRKLWLVLLMAYMWGVCIFMKAVGYSLISGDVRSLFAGSGNSAFYYGSILLGCLMAFFSFDYVMQEEQSEFYFALPLSRHQLFGTAVKNDVSIFIVLLVIGRFLFSLAASADGKAKGDILWNQTCVAVGVNILVFLLFYMISVLSIFLVEYRWAAFGMNVFLVFFGNALSSVMEKMFGEINTSFYRSKWLYGMKIFLSPVSLSERMAQLSNADDLSWNLTDSVPYIAIITVLIFLLVGLCLYLFDKRNMQRSGLVLAFPKTSYFFGGLAVTGITLWLTSGFMSLEIHGFSMRLMLVGAVLGLLLGHCLYQGLLHMDVKSIFGGKAFWGVEVSLIVLVLLSMVLWGKQNEKLPDYSKIVSASVYVQGFDWEQRDECDLVLERMKLSGMELDMLYGWLRDNEEKQENERDRYYDENETELVVKFDLKSGKRVYYRFLPGDADLWGMTSLYDSEDFKRGMYSILGERADEGKEITYSNGVDKFTLDLSRQEKEEFLAIYQEEFLSQKFQDISDNNPLGIIGIERLNEEECRGLVYSSFEKTIGWLKQRGVVADKELIDYNVTRVEATHYEDSTGLLYSLHQIDWQKDISDPKTIEELQKELFPEELYAYPLFHQIDSSYEYEVYYRDSEGQTVKHLTCLAGQSFEVLF